MVEAQTGKNNYYYIWFQFLLAHFSFMMTHVKRFYSPALFLKNNVILIFVFFFFRPEITTFYSSINLMLIFFSFLMFHPSSDTFSFAGETENDGEDIFLGFESKLVHGNSCIFMHCHLIKT